MLHLGTVDHHVQRLPGAQAPDEQAGAERSERQGPFTAGSERGGIVAESRPGLLLRLRLAELEGQKAGLSRFLVHAIARIDAFAAVDAAVIGRDLARIDLDEAGAHAVAALAAAVRAAGIVTDVQSFAGAEAVLPNPVHAGEAAPEVADQGHVEQDDQHENEVNIVQRSGEPGIGAPGHERPYGAGGIEIKERHHRDEQRGAEQGRGQQDPVERFVLGGGNERCAAVHGDLGAPTQELAGHEIAPFRQDVLRAHPAAKDGAGDGVQHHQAARQHDPQAGHQKKICEPNLPVQHHQGAGARIDAEQP